MNLALTILAVAEPVEAVMDLTVPGPVALPSQLLDVTE